MASSRRFEDLKDELISFKEKIRIQLRRNANEMSINKIFIDGDQLVEAMKIEVEKCPASVHREMNERLFSVCNEWNAFKATARRPALLSGGSSQGSFGGRSNFGEPITNKAILKEGIETLEQTGQSLMRAELVARESEEIGTSIVTELGGQRETLLRARGRLDNTNVNLKKSHRLIRVLNSQVITNKFLLIVIILVEICILLAIVYLRFIHHK